TSVNDPPVANAQMVTVSEDSSVGISLTASDVEGDSLTFSIVLQPAHGLLSGTAPNLTYTPSPNYNGPDSFDFKVNDGQIDSEIATVSIMVKAVNDAPMAVNDTYTVNEDTVLNIPAPGVLGNDYDLDGDTLSVQLVNNVSHGTLILNSSGGFTYTPSTNYFGTDWFTYRAYDGQTYSNVAVVTITINNINDPPIALNDSYTVAEDTILSVSAPGILGNDTDPEGGLLNASKVSDPVHGSLVLSGNGGFSYSPALNYNGADSFTYLANDGQGNSNVATVNIVITPVNDPPIANPQTKIMAEDGNATIILTASDVDGDVLRFSVVTPPTHGTLSGTPPNLTYAPTPNYNGYDSFTFKVNDGQMDSSVAMVGITITPVNDAPLAINDSGYRANISGINITAPGVLGNDSDIEGDLLTAQLKSGPLYGALTLYSDGSFIYVPAADYHGTDSFTYQAYDGNAYSTPATVIIDVDTVRPQPPEWVLPVGNNGYYIMREDVTTLRVTVSDNDVKYVLFQWWDAENGEYKSLGRATQSPYVISLRFSDLPVNQLHQVFAEVWDNFENGSLEGGNGYPQTVRRIFIFPTTLRNQIYLPLIFK
ncbi:MAG: cadherin-like domain-containing protein, partial [Thermanaerothrix sp.]|nr:cadherin-like domain-containing protein [Thermanaerothrix sp.]